jgi:hypothetical protein
MLVNRKRDDRTVTVSISDVLGKHKISRIIPVRKPLSVQIFLKNTRMGSWQESGLEESSIDFAYVAIVLAVNEC